MKQLLTTLIEKCGYEISRRGRMPVDFEEDAVEIIRFVEPYTMTSYERIYGLINAVKHIERHDIPGGIVECGVWRGGSTMTVARTLMACGSQERDLYLFDTFEGMSPPTADDVSFDGTPASREFEETRTGPRSSDWCFCSIEEVKKNLESTGYDPSKQHFIKGMVEDTIPGTLPSSIALLRLDTDFYESTRHELNHLFPALAPGGVLIIDDYGHWQGARKAVDEYLEANHIELLLSRMDGTGRIGVKRSA